MHISCVCVSCSSIISHRLLMFPGDHPHQARGPSRPCSSSPPPTRRASRTQTSTAATRSTCPPSCRRYTCPIYRSCRNPHPHPNSNPNPHPHPHPHPHPDTPGFVQALEPALFTEAVALACGVSESDYQLGLSKIFLRAGKGLQSVVLAISSTVLVSPHLFKDRRPTVLAHIHTHKLIFTPSYSSRTLVHSLTTYMHMQG